MNSDKRPLRSLKDAQNLRIGILGDGQLAQMLVEASKPMQLNLSILGSDHQSPAAQTGVDFTLGDLTNSLDFLNFCKDKDLLTIESEFIDPALLETSPIPVWPHPQTLISLRDRLPQKKSLIASGIPTSPLHLFSSFDEAKTKLKSHSQGLVFKKRLFGYDGYGTRVVKTYDDLVQFEHTEGANAHLQDWIAEDFVSFQRELAISFARNTSGQIMEFPLVESHQQNSKCLWVKGPIETTPYRIFIERLKSYINEIHFVGLITFELFENQHGLLVNEVAPRVHNSAHYSIEALDVSQFTAHLMAICNMPLPNQTQLKAPAFAMYNLIGEREMAAQELRLASLEGTDIHLHWYQKAQSRKGRKLGHLTTLADTPEEALLKLEKTRKDFEL